MPATRRSRFRAVVSRLKAFSIFTDAFSSWGTKWKVTSGSWSATSGTSKTTTPASSYPLAAVQMSKSNVTATVKSPQPGAGIALWVTDSGNWWGVVREQTVNNSYNCSTCTGSSPFSYPFTNSSPFSYPFTNSSPFSYPFTTSSPYSYPFTFASGNNPGSNFYLAIFSQKFFSPGNTNYSNATGFGANYSNATGFGANYSNATGFGANYANATGFSANYFYFTCNCQTSYPQRIRLLRSLAGTVTEITSWAVGAATDTINAIRVTNSGTALTIKAYSDTNATTQIGSDMTHTATGATVGTQFGVVISPATNGQGTGTGEVSISVS